MEEEMANRSAARSRLIDRRTVLQVAAALAAAGPALMREGHAAARPPVVIDAQVHAYAANTPERPWHSVPNWPAHVTARGCKFKGENVWLLRKHWDIPT